MSDGSRILDPTLKPGDRFQLTSKGKRLLRPRSTGAGYILADWGEEWRLQYDSGGQPRRVHKFFVERETFRP